MSSQGFPDSTDGINAPVVLNLLPPAGHIQDGTEIWMTICQMAGNTCDVPLVGLETFSPTDNRCFIVFESANEFPSTPHQPLFETASAAKREIENGSS